MASFIWNREPQEAYLNPYEYKAQDQFVREAKKVLDILFLELMKYTKTFKVDDLSIKKAVWMLQVDAVDSLRDCIVLLKKKNHRIAGRLLRDVMETLDIAAFFSTNTEESNKELKKWYKDEVIPHRIYRNFIKKTKGEKEAENIKIIYEIYSKITHRTYRTLAYSYVLGKDSKIIYEGEFKSLILVPPETISMYYALLANLIYITSFEINKGGLIKNSIIQNIWKNSFEEKCVPRRFEERKKLINFN